MALARFDKSLREHPHEWHGPKHAEKTTKSLYVHVFVKLAAIDM